MDKYILELSLEQKRKIGFHFDPILQEYVYKFPVYKYKNKPTIICKLGINEEINEVWFNVYKINGDLYTGYYNREYGKSKIYPVIDKNIIKELKKLGAKKVRGYIWQII